jgi:hypothetical protein
LNCPKKKSSGLKPSATYFTRCPTCSTEFNTTLVSLPPEEEKGEGEGEGMTLPKDYGGGGVHYSPNGRGIVL